MTRRLEEATHAAGSHPRWILRSESHYLNAGNRAQFNGSFPFHNTRSALLAAYETPLIAGRLGFVLDYLGGTGELSDTYLGVVLNITGTTAFGAGTFLANDRSNSPSDGVFFDLSETFDVTKLADRP